MTNREKYKNAFSSVEPSKNFAMEVERMEFRKKKNVIKAVAAAIAVCLLIGGGSGVAYAMDLGGIQRIIQVWIHGDLTEAVVNYNTEGEMATYTLKYADDEGNDKEIQGGGVAFEEDGTVRSLTADELEEHLYMPEIICDEETGKSTLYYYDQAIDVTDMFVDGYCYITLKGNDGKSLYVTAHEDGRLAASPHKYVDASGLE